MRKALLLFVLALFAAPVFAQRPSVYQVTANPQGTSCTYGTSPIQGYNDGSVMRWYYCASGTSTYQVVGSGVGDMLKSAYDLDNLGAAVLLHSTNNCAGFGTPTNADAAGGAGKTYLCYQDDNDTLYAWDKTADAWTAIAGGSTDTTCATAGVNCTLSTGDTVPWSILTGVPSDIADGDANTTIAEGLPLTVGVAFKVASTSPTTYTTYTPCGTDAACTLHPSTVVDVAGPGTSFICTADGTNCPTGIVDTGPVPAGCTADQAQLGDASCADVIEEAELGTFSDLVTQLSISGTCNSSTFVRADGSCQPVATTFESATDVPSYTGNGGKFVRIKATVDGVEFVTVAKTDLPSTVSYDDEGNVFQAAQTISHAIPTLKFVQNDTTDQNAWLYLDGNQLSLQRRTNAEALSNTFALFNTAAPTNSIYQDAEGDIGLGTASPGTEELKIVRSSAAVGVYLDSDSNESVLSLDGTRATDGSVSWIHFLNGGQSNAYILARRAGAQNTANLAFDTRTAGVQGTRMIITGTEVQLGSGVGLEINGPLELNSNNITEGAAATFAGTVTAGSISVPATATTGQYVKLCEDTDLGDGCIQIALGDTNLTDATTDVFKWAVNPATCTGDGNGGALTLTGSSPNFTIVCSADDGGGGGGGDPNYNQSFTSQTSVLLQHNLGTANVMVACYDGSDNEILPLNKTIGSGTPWDVTVTFSTAQTGRCVVNGTGGASSANKHIASFTSQTSVSVTAATHGLGTNDLHVQCVDAAATPARIEPGEVTISSGGDVTITFAVAQSGECVIL